MTKRGRIYQRGTIWWIQYFFNGQDRRETTHSTSEKIAKKLLTKRQAAKDAGTLQQKRFADLRAIIEGEYQLNRRKSLERLQNALQSLERTFAGWSTTAITEPRFIEYVNARLAEGRAHATVKYELAVLRRAFKLAKLPCPPFPPIQLDNVRTGFFERHDFEAVLAQLPAYLRPVMTFAYLTGWRTISEVLTLQWNQVDFRAGIVRLEPGNTKNRHGRTFPFAVLPELADVLRAQWETAQQAQRTGSRLVPWVFFRETGQGVQPIKSYKTAWAHACRGAGVPDRLVHDLRRTAVRNLRRAGVPESVAMKLTGHKTISVFLRYDIVDEQDLSLAVNKLAVFHAADTRLRDNHGTIQPIRAAAGGQGNA